MRLHQDSKWSLDSILGPDHFTVFINDLDVGLQVLQTKQVSR